MKRKKVKRLILLFCIICIGKSGLSQQEKGLHYIGGMYYGVGLHSFSTPLTSQDVIANNIGGRLAFSIGNHVRIGIMGGNTFKHYDERSSFYKIGHGGMTAEYFLIINRLTAGAGIYIGGAKYRNLYVTGQNGTDISGDYRNISFMFLTPFVTLSYRLTSKLSLSVMAESFNDALFSQTIGSKGINVKAGVLFSR